MTGAHKDERRPISMAVKMKVYTWVSWAEMTMIIKYIIMFVDVNVQESIIKIENKIFFRYI